MFINNKRDMDLANRKKMSQSYYKLEDNRWNGQWIIRTSREVDVTEASF